MPTNFNVNPLIPSLIEMRSLVSEIKLVDRHDIPTVRSFCVRVIIVLEFGLLGYHALWLPTFQRKSEPPFSGPEGEGIIIYS